MSASVANRRLRRMAANFGASHHRFAPILYDQSDLILKAAAQVFVANISSKIQGSFNVRHGPQSQAGTMVMPYHMRWMYMDPQGQQQGPFTGLEMDEWYKAIYLPQGLRVRKVEDPDFETLGELIWRTCNSREPFLVPQVGIDHGDASHISD